MYDNVDKKIQVFGKCLGDLAWSFTGVSLKMLCLFMSAFLVDLGLKISFPVAPLGVFVCLAFSSRHARFFVF